MDRMLRHRSRIVAGGAALLAAAAVGAGVGAGTFAVLSDEPTASGDVTATSSEPVAQPGTATGEVSLAQIYARSYESVVEITASGVSAAQFGEEQQQRAQGSGFVYDANGTVVTNQHVVDGASSISVRFSNGSTHPARLVGTDPFD